MKLKCSTCGIEFDGCISKDELGWHSKCSNCESYFDVEVPKGKIIMAFAWDESRESFTDNWCDDNLIDTYYAFDTVSEFIEAWKKMSEKPDGMWYWLVDNGYCFCSGACGPEDIVNIYEHFGLYPEIEIMDIRI